MADATNDAEAWGRGLRRSAEHFRAIGAGSHFRAADPVSQELGGWHPSLTSPATEMWGERDPLVARIQDVTRNNGFAAGAKQTLVDTVIGANWRLSPAPNWRALGIDFKAAIAWSTDVAAKWRSYADDVGCWIDFSRRQRFGGLLRTQFNSWFLSGEHCAIGRWKPRNVQPGRGKYATCLQLIDPDRLSNPYNEPERRDLRQGVKLDPETNEPLGYFFRDAHPMDWPNALQSMTWTYVVRELPWGRPQVIHGFEVERDGQVRGKPPIASVVETLRLEDIYERTEAVSAVLNAMYAATIETDFAGMDAELIEQIFGKRHDGSASGPSIDMTFRGVKVPQLPPGTRLKFNTMQRGGAQFAQFEEAVLRRVAAGAGLSYEQVSRDYSKTNYSSARASLLEAWRFMQGRSEFMATSFADPAYVLWLEEAIARGEVELPKGVPDFYQARSDWTMCRWIGPGRGWIDPVKEVQASVMKIDAGLATLESEAAEQGRDWLEVSEQRAYEAEELKRLGLDQTSSKVYLANAQSITREDQPGQKQQEKDAAGWLASSFPWGCAGPRFAKTRSTHPAGA